LTSIRSPSYASDFDEEDTNSLDLEDVIPDGEHDDYEQEEVKREEVSSVAKLMEMYENTCIQLDELKKDIKELNIHIDHIFANSVERISTRFGSIHLNIVVLKKNGLHRDTCATFFRFLMGLLDYLIHKSSIFSLEDTKHEHKHVISRLNVVITDLHAMMVTEWAEEAREHSCFIKMRDFEQSTSRTMSTREEIGQPIIDATKIEGRYQDSFCCKKPSKRVVCCMICSVLLFIFIVMVTMFSDLKL